VLYRPQLDYLVVLIAADHLLGDTGILCQKDLAVVVDGGGEKVFFARKDIDPKEFPDPIRQEMQQFVAKNPDKLILDQHGTILPNPAQVAYRVIISTFFASAKPDVDATIKAVAI
jgi:hypothetical protein